MIQVKNLKKSFGKNEVLKDINVTVKNQEVVVVIGPSGSGKSTFLRCINMLETITGGHVLIEGIDLTDKNTDINKVRTEVGMVFQQFNLFPHKKVIENIMLAPMKVRNTPKEKARAKGLDAIAHPKHEQGFLALRFMQEHLGDQVRILRFDCLELRIFVASDQDVVR